MVHDVGQRLLDNAIGRDFDGRRQRRQIVRRVYRDAQSGGSFAAASVRSPNLRRQNIDSRNQPQIVQRRRPQLMNHAPDVVDGGPDIALHLARQPLGRRWVGRNETLQHPGFQEQRRQRRAKPVVQVATQAAALLFATGYQLQPRALQVSRQLCAIHSRARLSGDTL